MITTRVDLSGLRDLGVTASDVVGAATIAATRTARAAIAPMRQHLEERLDRPTRFTLNAMRSTPARLGDPRPVATIALRDDVRFSRHYLINLDRGLRRRAKGLELALRRAGKLEAGEFLIEGDEGTGVPLDRFGNVPARVTQIILSDLKAQQDRGANSTRESRARRRRRRGSRAIRGTFFRVSSRFFNPDAGLPPGIYLKQPDGELDLYYHIVNRAPDYPDLIDLPETGMQAIRRQYLPEFRQAFSQAIARRVGRGLGLTTRRPGRRRL
ncbi:MAG: hypothetical protein AAFW01_00090 [Pseudomonadota bacterium]